MFSQIILFDLLANHMTMRPSVTNPENVIMTSDLDSGKMTMERGWTIFNGACVACIVVQSYVVLLLFLNFH